MKIGAEFILALMVMVAGAALLVVSGGDSAGFVIISLGVIFLVYPAGPDRPVESERRPAASGRQLPGHGAPAGYHHHVRGGI